MKSLWEYPPPQIKVPPRAPHLPNNILALYLGQQALERCGESVLCSCMPAPASSGTAPASSGEVVKISRGAGFWVTMGFYGHVKSRYTFWGHLGPFPQLRQISPELATSSGNRKPRQVNRIHVTAQVQGEERIVFKKYMGIVLCTYRALVFGSWYVYNAL